MFHTVQQSIFCRFMRDVLYDTINGLPKDLRFDFNVTKQTLL